MFCYESKCFASLSGASYKEAEECLIHCLKLRPPLIGITVITPQFYFNVSMLSLGIHPFILLLFPSVSTSSPTKVNVSNFDLVMESDLGTFSPVGLQFTGSDAAQKVRLNTSVTQFPYIYTG